MPANEGVDQTIQILMERSLWGSASSFDSLINDFRNEANEFIEGSQKRDISNMLEEASDVLMMMLCIIYRIKPDLCDALHVLSDAFIKKLHSRYPQFYDGSVEDCHDKSEYEIWDEAKKHEAICAYMFCTNDGCSERNRIGRKNIAHTSGNYICECCNSVLIPTTKNVFLFRSPRRKKYVNLILNSIREKSRGDKSAAARLVEEEKSLCDYFYRDVLCSEKREVFIEYAARTLNVCSDTIGVFLSDIQIKIEERKKFMTTMETYEQYIVDYCEYIRSNHSSPLALYNSQERSAVLKVLRETTMDLEKKLEKCATYKARSWNNQYVSKLLLKYDESRIIECMAIFHYQDSRVNDLTIEVSNMYNCVVGCSFCASGALPETKKVLNPIDYLRQVNTCIKEVGASPNDYDNFYISFAGIGEPSVVFRNIAEGMIMLRDVYPKVKFNIATFGFNDACFEFWNSGAYPIRTLQLPFYTFDQSDLRMVVRNLPDGYDLVNVVKKAIAYREKHKECRVKINYLVMRGINDTQEQIEQFIAHFAEFKEQLTVKMSYLNYTKPGEEGGFVSPGMEKLEEMRTKLAEAGFRCYVFGTDKNDGLGCGQLVQNYISQDS